MRDVIRQQLTEYRAEALKRIAKAEDKTRSIHAQNGTSFSSMCVRAINEDNEFGLAAYMAQSIAFIRHVAPGSSAQYADELRDAGNKLKQEIIAKPDKARLGEALDKLINRKVEDFELGSVEGQEMNTTTNNSVNIIGSNISNFVVQIAQSAKHAIFRDTAQQLEQLVNSKEIKALPESDRLDVHDQVTDLVKELHASATDKGKVHRGLNRLGGFLLGSVSAKVAAEIVTKLAVAWL